MVRYLAAIACLCLALLNTGPLQARNLALVIGNSEYENTAALANPTRDAETFARFLVGVGYEVTRVSDGTRADMSAALGRFVQRLKADDIAVFYYAGHGLQMDGENYLVGVEAKLMTEFDVAGESIDLNGVIALMESKARVSMLFIDACRNNPLADAMAKTATRAVSRGLAPVQVSGDGSMVAFAAGPGQLAFDGEGSNSPFTASLVKHLGTPGLEVSVGFKRVISEVRAMTSGRQDPQIVSSLATEIFFGGAGNSPLPSQPTIDLSEIDYAKAERLNTTRGWQLFLEKHPNGFFSELAQQALEMLFGASEAERLTPEQAEQRLELSPQSRREIQVALNGLGYQVGGADGIFGDNTRRQIARYQLAAGLQETGYVSAPMLTQLGIAMVSSDTTTFSADEAREFNPEDLAGLETDARLLRAIECLRNRPVRYAFREGHIYIAVLTFGASYEQSKDEARRCGGDLVSITSAAENNFVFELFRHDERFMERNDNGTAIIGPLIGLEQDPAGREPGGGWKWSDGTPLTFEMWEESEPSNTGGDEEFATFWNHDEPRRGPNEPDVMSRPGWNDIRGSARGYVMEIS